MKSKKLTREIVSSRYRTRQQAFWHHAGGAPKVLLQAMIMQRAAGHVVAEVEGAKDCGRRHEPAANARAHDV